MSLIDQLPAGITFTGSSASQGTYNAATGLWTIGTIDEGASAVITLTGTVDAAQAGSTITNITTAATGDQVDPSTVGDDLEESISPLVVADLGIAKSIVGEPILTETGNFVVSYQVVVENTGNVDLADLSLVEDLQSQFGAPFVDAGNLTLTRFPSDARSSIAVNSATWNGSSSTELIDNASGSLLVVGDSFTVEFDVEIDPSLVEDAPLANQVEGSAEAVNASGDPLTDANGAPIIVTDESDSGTDPGTNNSDSPDDRGTSDDPTLFDPPAVPSGSISGSVFQDDNNDGLQQPGEAGIEGVVITLTGTDVFGNAVNIQTTTDAFGQYTFDGLNAGEYTVTQTQPDGFTDGIDRDHNGLVSPINDVLPNISLGFGDTFENGTFGERRSGASGNPPQFQNLGAFNSASLSNLLGGFGGSSPGTIYSGVPINGNNDPLSLDSGRQVTGGYALSQAEQLDGDDCGCCEVVDPCDPCGNVIPIEQIIDDGCGCGPVSPQGQILYEDASIEGVEVIPVDAESVSEADGTASEETEGDVVDQIDQQRSEETASDDATIRKPSFLKRMAKWMNV